MGVQGANQSNSGNNIINPSGFRSLGLLIKSHSKEEGLVYTIKIGNIKHHCTEKQLKNRIVELTGKKYENINLKNIDSKNTDSKNTDSNTINNDTILRAFFEITTEDGKAYKAADFLAEMADTENTSQAANIIAAMAKAGKAKQTAKILAAMVNTKNTDQAADIIAKMDENQVHDIIAEMADTENTGQAAKILAAMVNTKNTDQAADIIAKMDENQVHDIIAKMVNTENTGQAAKILAAMVNTKNTDQAADIIAKMDENQVHDIIAKMVNTENTGQAADIIAKMCKIKMASATTSHKETDDNNTLSELGKIKNELQNASIDSKNMTISDKLHHITNKLGSNNIKTKLLTVFANFNSIELFLSNSTENTDLYDAVWLLHETSIAFRDTLKNGKATPAEIDVATMNFYNACEKFSTTLNKTLNNLDGQNDNNHVYAGTQNSNIAQPASPYGDDELTEQDFWKEIYSAKAKQKEYATKKTPTETDHKIATHNTLDELDAITNELTNSTDITVNQNQEMQTASNTNNGSFDDTLDELDAITNELTNSTDITADQNQEMQTASNTNNGSFDDTLDNLDGQTSGTANDNAGNTQSTPKNRSHKGAENIFSKKINTILSRLRPKTKAKLEIKIENGIKSLIDDIKLINDAKNFSLGYSYITPTANNAINHVQQIKDLLSQNQHESKYNDIIKELDNIIKNLEELIEITDSKDHTDEVIENLNEAIDKINKVIGGTDVTDQQTIGNNRN